MLEGDRQPGARALVARVLREVEGAHELAAHGLGALDAQDAFLAGAIPIEGDEGLAIGLALAAMSPD